MSNIIKVDRPVTVTLECDDCGFQFKALLTEYKPEDKKTEAVCPECSYSNELRHSFINRELEEGGGK